MRKISEALMDFKNYEYEMFKLKYNSESDSAEIYDNTGKLVYRLEK